MGGLACAKEIIDNENALKQVLGCMDASILLYSSVAQPTYAQRDSFLAASASLVSIAQGIERFVRTAGEEGVSPSELEELYGSEGEDVYMLESKPTGSSGVDRSYQESYILEALCEVVGDSSNEAFVRWISDQESPLTSLAYFLSFKLSVTPKLQEPEGT